MTINLSNEGEKVFNSMCDFNIEDAYIPTGPASTQKAHYIDVLLNH